MRIGSLTPVTTCMKCGVRMKAHLIEEFNVYSRVCGRCGLLNIARAMEEVEEGDSLADISSGEQIGAFFRDVAKRTQPDDRILF